MQYGAWWGLRTIYLVFFGGREGPLERAESGRAGISRFGYGGQDRARCGGRRAAGLGRSGNIQGGSFDDPWLWDRRLLSKEASRANSPNGIPLGPIGLCLAVQGTKQ